MKIVMSDILEKIIYGTTNNDNIIEIARLIQLIRKSTYIFESDRQYPRIALRTVFKWYFKGYSHKNHIGDK